MQAVELTMKGTEFLLRGNCLAILRRILASYRRAVRDKERNRNIICSSIIMVCLFIITGRSRNGLNKKTHEQAG